MATYNGETFENINSAFQDKSTDTIVVYPITDDERAVGLTAKNQMRRNLPNTFQFFNRFLGLKNDRLL